MTTVKYGFGYSTPGEPLHSPHETPCVGGIPGAHFRPPGGPFLASSRGLGCGKAAQVEEEAQVGQVETALQGWMDDPLQW